MQNSTSLNVEGWGGKTLLLTIVFTSLFFGILEAVLRQDGIQSQFTAPKMGSSHFELGQKLTDLDRFVKKNGPIDCIMIGSSMVDVGLDPESFASGYREITGANIDCFNFGLDASSAASTQAIAKIMMDDYQPRLLIIGTDPRDFVVPRDDPEVAVVLDTPWIRYRSGDVSLEGWLMDTSYFYRYRQHLNRLLRFKYEDTLVKMSRANPRLHPNGYTSLEKVKVDIKNRPDPNSGIPQIQYYYRIFASYQILDINRDAMEQMLASGNSDVQILVIEMPVSDGYYDFFKNGSDDYDKFVNAVETTAGEYQVPFWRTESMDLVPDQGWADYSHLNATGSKLFSVWLGRQVALAEFDGRLHISDR